MTSSLNIWLNINIATLYHITLQLHGYILLYHINHITLHYIIYIALHRVTLHPSTESTYVNPCISPHLRSCRPPSAP